MGNTTVRYADDKPKDCKYCYFWGGKKKGCTLGGVENCYYLIKEDEAPVEKTKCDEVSRRQQHKGSQHEIVCSCNTV